MYGLERAGQYYSELLVVLEDMRAAHSVLSRRHELEEGPLRISKSEDYLLAGRWICGE
jgi:hypothetical protein